MQPGVFYRLGDVSANQFHHPHVIIAVSVDRGRLEAQYRHHLPLGDEGDDHEGLEAGLVECRDDGDLLG